MIVTCIVRVDILLIGRGLLLKCVSLLYYKVSYTLQATTFNKNTKLFYSVITKEHTPYLRARTTWDKKHSQKNMRFEQCCAFKDYVLKMVVDRISLNPYRD